MCEVRYPRITAKIGDRIVGEDDAMYRQELVEGLDLKYPGQAVTYFWRDRPHQGDTNEITREELLAKC